MHCYILVKCSTFRYKTSRCTANTSEGRATAQNVRLYYPSWQYTDIFIFQFESLLCLRTTLRLLYLSKRSLVGRKCISLTYRACGYRIITVYVNPI